MSKLPKRNTFQMMELQTLIKLKKQWKNECFTDGKPNANYLSWEEYKML